MEAEGQMALEATTAATDLSGGSMARPQLLAVVDLLIAAIAGLIAGTVYWLGSAPGLLFGDGGEFQFSAWLAGLPHPTGYPLYMILGWIWTHLLDILNLATPARAMNLLSVIFAAVAVGLTYLFAHGLVELGVRQAPPIAQRIAAFLAALAFAFTPTFWSSALVTEVYSLHAAFIALIFGLALRWQKGLEIEKHYAQEDQPEFRTHPSLSLMVLALVLGLSLAHHRTTLLLIPVLFVFVWRQDGYRVRRPRWLVPLTVLTLAPLLLYLYVPLRVKQSPYLLVELRPDHFVDLINRSPKGLAGYALGYSFASQLQGPATAVSDPFTLIQRFMAELTPVGVGLALLGVLYLIINRETRLLWLTGGGFIALTAFNLFYTIDDIAAYYIPSYLIASGWIAVAGAFIAAEIAQLVARWRPAWATAASVLTLIPLAALPLLLFISHADQVDRSGHTLPERWWANLIEADPPADSILVTNDRDEMMPLWYLQQVEGMRPDLAGLFPGMLPGENWDNVGQVLEIALANERPVFLVKPMPGLEAKAQLGQNDSAGLTRVEGLNTLRGDAQPVDIAIGDQIRLTGYDVETLHPAPGQDTAVTLFWQPVQPIATDLSSFVHLTLPDGSKIAQSDKLIGGDYYPSRLWKPGEIIVDRHVVSLPADAPPGPFRVYAGMYELMGDELQPVGAAILPGSVGGQAPKSSTLELATLPGYANFDDSILLIGYGVDGNRVSSVHGKQVVTEEALVGDLEVSVRWQAAGPIGQDYKVFIHVLDSNGRIVAQQDVQPFDGQYPTSVWEQGELLTDSYEVPLFSELRPGPYRIVVGIYDALTLNRLPAYDDARVRLPNDAIELAEIEIN
ncbi:MAG: DUF2723 domain-containing protein [Chloroflexota bacterium]|nr:DUF2723 domain-containing protein [Chloroflexota bacterium]